MGSLREITQVFKGKSYETQMILLTALLGSARIAIALYLDSVRSQPSLLEIGTDFVLFLVFVGLFWLGYRKANIQSVHPLFGVLLIAMLALNFVEFGGVEGEARFNYYSGIYIIVLLYSGVRLYTFLIIQFLIAASICWSIFFNHQWTKIFTIDAEATPLDFVFALVALGFLSAYLKSITLREIDGVESLNLKLHDSVEEARRVNQELTTQGQALQEAQERMEAEVQKRSLLLEQNQMAIEAYIHVNTAVLNDPIQNLHESLQKIPADDQLQTLLKVSGEELQTVFISIKEALEKEEELNRTKIRPQ